MTSGRMWRLFSPIQIIRRIERWENARLGENLVATKTSDNIDEHYPRVDIGTPKTQGRALTLRINISRTKGSRPQYHADRVLVPD